VTDVFDVIFVFMADNQALGVTAPNAQSGLDKSEQ